MSELAYRTFDWVDFFRTHEANGILKNSFAGSNLDIFSEWLNEHLIRNWRLSELRFDNKTDIYVCIFRKM